MRTTKTLCLIPALAALALAQDPAPATPQTQHEEHQTRSTESSRTTTTTSPRSFNGKLVDADCSALTSRWSSSGTMSADRSSTSSTSTSERPETTTSSQDISREGAPPTDRTATDRSQDSVTTRSSSSSADRSSQPMMSSSDLDSCAVKSSTSSYALAMPNGQVYKLSGSTVSDSISNHKKWSNRISQNDTKNMKVKVRGSLEGDTITVESIK